MPIICENLYLFHGMHLYQFGPANLLFQTFCMKAEVVSAMSVISFRGYLPHSTCQKYSHPPNT